MKKYTCDICKKEFGVQVATFSQPMYSPSNFLIDSGFYHTQKYEADICEGCYNQIAKAQQEAIEKIINNNK